MQKIILPLIALVLLASPATARPGRGTTDDSYTRFENHAFGYSIMVPQCWKKTEADLSYKHILLFQKGTYAEIKISASKASDEILEKWKNWDQWYIRGIGARPFEIIKTGRIVIDRKTSGRLLLLEYSLNGTRMIQRVLLTRHGDTMIVIECGGTVKQFYAYNEVFNTVMGSLMFTGAVVPVKPEKKDSNDIKEKKPAPEGMEDKETTKETEAPEKKADDPKKEQAKEDVKKDDGDSDDGDDNEEYEYEEEE